MDLPAAFAARFLILAPMAFCIFVILISEDRLHRLLAVIGLIVLEQIREAALVSSMNELRKHNKH
ncbi:Uncharacterised protein [uncultured archaeon]|nr:Uncharacterised protein [uncultured archaeon]